MTPAWLKGIFGNSQPNNAEIASERLKMMIYHQRNENSNPELVENIKNDIVKVIQKHLGNFDQDHLKISVDPDDHSISYLDVSVPLSKS